MPAGASMRNNPEISVVVISRNEGIQLRRTVDNLVATLPCDSEILVVDDGSDDGSADFLDSAAAGNVRLARNAGLGVARARNWGARQTTGGVLIWADAHLVLPDGWIGPLLEALDAPGVAAAAPAIHTVDEDGAQLSSGGGCGLFFREPSLRVGWLSRKQRAPYAVPILPGCTLAMKREMFEQTGGFDDQLLSRGGVDNELGVRLNLQGYALHVVPEVSVGHYFRPVSPYQVRWVTFLHNYIRLALLHFEEARAAVVLAALRKHGAFAEALDLARQRLGERRAQLDSTRVHDDNWFFQRFEMNW